MWRGTLTRGATLPSRGVPAPRRIAAVAASLAVALAPAAARAQDGAGDEQYTDPFAGQSQPKPKPKPTAPAPAAAQPAQQQPRRSTTDAAAGARRAHAAAGRLVARAPAHRLRRRPRGPASAWRSCSPGWRCGAAAPPMAATETGSAAETEALAARLAASLRPGDVVLVSGELGAGKTTFVRGAARALGVGVPVTSPTFTIARRYEDGRVPVSHLDLYRLDGLDGEEPELLADELAGDRDRLRRVARAGRRATSATCRVAARVRLEHLGGDRRRVIIEHVILGLDTATPATVGGRPARRRRAGRAAPRAGARRAPGPRRAAARRWRAAALDAVGARLRRRAADRRRRRARAPSPGCGSASPPRARWPRRTGAEVAAVSTLEALAAAAGTDARRARRARRPPRRGLRRRLPRRRAARWPRSPSPRRTSPRSPIRAHAPWLAVGDGAVRFRDRLEPAAEVPADASPLHRVSALAVCRLAREARARRPRRPPAGVRAPARTPCPADDRRARHPPPHLRRPPAGHRHRAARLPDAVVAGDVRARALQARRGLPGRAPRRRASSAT